MLIRNYSPQKASFRIPHKTGYALKDSIQFSLQRSSSQQPIQQQDKASLNNFLVNQNAQRILSPFKKTQRESLGFHNLNILSLRNVSGHNQLFLSKDSSPSKKRNLNTHASTIRSELVIQATQKNQEEFRKDFKRSSTPLNISKRNIQMRSTSFSNLNLNKQDSVSPTKNSSGLDSSRGMLTFSTNFQNTPKTDQSNKMRRSESQGFYQPAETNLNSQIQIKINEYENLNSKIQEYQQEKQMMQLYIEKIKKEIANESQKIRILNDNQTKYNREANINIMGNNRLGEESLYRSLEIQKQFDEFKQIQQEYEHVKSCNNQVLEQIEAEKLQIEQTRGSIYSKKKDQLDMNKQKERIMKGLQMQHKMMIAVEKKYIDKANLQNQIIHNVNQNCLSQDFLEKNNLLSDTINSKNNIVSLSQINEDIDKQGSLILKNDNLIPSSFKTSPTKKNKKNDNTLQFSLDKNQTNSYNQDF